MQFLRAFLKVDFFSGESIDPCCQSQNENRVLNATANGNLVNGTSSRFTRTPCDPEVQMDSDEELINEPGLSVMIQHSASNQNSSHCDSKNKMCPKSQSQNGTNTSDSTHNSNL